MRSRRSALRATSTTVKPALAKRRATALPNPSPTPATSATCLALVTDSSTRRPEGASPSRVFRCGQAAAFLEDARAAGGANGAVEPRERAGDRLALAAEDVLGADLGEIAAALEQFLDRLAQAVKVELPAAGAPASRLLNEQLRARHVDEVDALRHQEQMLLAGAVLAQGVEVALDVTDRAEIDRALDAQDLELRAFQQTVLDFGHLALAVARIGHEAAHDGVRGAVEVEHEGSQHSDEDRELEIEQERREEGYGEHGALAAARGEDLADAVKIDQVPGDKEQHAGHDRDRQIGGERRDGNEHQDQPQRGEYRRHRRLRARVVVDAAAVGRGARGKSREESRGDVGEALADEFLVVVEPLTGLERDRMRDRGRLSERDERHGYRASQKALQRAGREVREGQRRQRAGQ